MISRLKAIALALCSVVMDGLVNPAVGFDTAATARVEFNRDIRPILSEYCLACHGFDSQHRAADLRLDQRDGALRELDSGQFAIVPHQPDLSALFERISSTDDSERMPPSESGKQLNQSQIELLKRWIEQGAEYEPHWAFAPVKTSHPPIPLNDSYLSSWGNPVDAFINVELERRKILPSERASPETLIRRAHLDLIGLLPTVEEVQAFKIDFEARGNVAFQELVEQLLNSPHYGERWGRWWLDQARYADSNGYSIDSPRSIWPYRDWVIDALNSDMTWDQFVVEQIAGDLLPDATQAQKVATGFHRNTQFNEEGGIDPEQFRIERVFDRVATTGTVFMGLTIGCAQCHDHKFDPVTQKEYYQLFAFFNDQDEPSIQLQRLEYANSPQANSNAGTDAEIKPESHDKKSNAPSTLVLKERQEPRPTHVFTQGDFTRKAELVAPGVPQVLPPLTAEKERYNRLDLAQWMVAPENPLTTRVLVNRVWQKYFGQGIVATENDFGLQSSVPTHPELLDWLAANWRENSMRLKDLHRQIVCSDVYMRSSHLREDLREKDRSNEYLARQTRLRLDAELIRDVGLVASGLLDSKIGGEPVFPPIPEGVMSQGQVRRNWKTSEGADRYRRGMYTFLYRATPPPSLNVFDAPEGNATCTHRNRSNTPLQALTLLNDTAQFEFAQALQKIVEQHGIAYAFQRCTSRLPTESEIKVLNGLDSLSVARVLLNLDETITRE